MEKVLVTGADGFIGSHLTEKMVAAGYDVRAFVYYNSFGTWGWLENCDPNIKNQFEVFQGDIRDPFGVKQAMMGCDIVLHLAALIAIPYSYHSPDMYIDTNIKGTLNVLQAARELGLKRVIHTSTSEVYGTAQFVPITEDHPVVGQSPYSASKIGADQIAQSYYRSFDIPVVIIRPFNTFGPRQSARAVIPTIITQLIGDQPKLKIGSTHPTRDFSYVDDTVNGFIAATMAEGILGETINLGSSFEISIGDTISSIARIMNMNIKVATDDVRIRPEKSEVERLYADNTKAKLLMEWKPKFEGLSGFEEGLKRTIEWFRNPANTGMYKSGIYNI